ncbi:hypothetical protein F5883DRAFT_419154, partial [Diaporthe sp. PMI_573]
IDCLCIDQKNDFERAEQVKLMGTLFRRAYRTLVWLGQHSCCADWMHYGGVLSCPNS